jgi:quercetin dioxygenase-like cupin family protein
LILVNAQDGEQATRPPQIFAALHNQGAICCSTARPGLRLFRQSDSDFVQRLAEAIRLTQHLPQTREERTMAELEKGITENGTGYGGVTWNILGQVYYPKAVTDSTFAFETNSDPGQFVPVHIHPTQEEFILVQEGTLDLKLDGKWVRAHAGDLVRMPRGIPHGYFNKSDKPCRALFWVSPAAKLEALFKKLDNLSDVAEIVRISAEHEVDFLPPEAND